ATCELAGRHSAPRLLLARKGPQVQTLLRPQSPLTSANARQGPVFGPEPEHFRRRRSRPLQALSCSDTDSGASTAVVERITSCPTVPASTAAFAGFLVPSVLRDQW